MKPFQMQLQDDLHKKLKIKSAKTDYTMAEYAKQSIIEKLERDQKND